MHMRNPLLPLALMALSMSAAGAAEPAGSAGAGSVTIKDFMFSPATVTIKAGSTVVWTNKDGEPHTVVSDAGLFRSGAVDTDESFSFKFDQPGTYRFLCSIHPTMVGTIVVE
jgi:plastocyanin